MNAVIAVTKENGRMLKRKHKYTGPKISIVNNIIFPTHKLLVLLNMALLIATLAYESNTEMKNITVKESIIPSILPGDNAAHFVDNSTDNDVADLLSSVMHHWAPFSLSIVKLNARTAQLKQSQT